jgi:hypothetical protein
VNLSEIVQFFNDSSVGTRQIQPTFDHIRHKNKPRPDPTQKETNTGSDLGQSTSSSFNKRGSVVDPGDFHRIRFFWIFLRKYALKSILANQKIFMVLLTTKMLIKDHLFRPGYGSGSDQKGPDPDADPQHWEKATGQNICNKKN